MLQRISFINDSGTRLQKLLNVPFPNGIMDNNKFISWEYPYIINSKRFNGMILRNNPDIFTEHDNPLLLIYEFKE
jgi:hypothetical protein